MASHTYSAEELLFVRQKPLREDMHRKLYARLKMDSELGDMIRIQSLSSHKSAVLPHNCALGHQAGAKAPSRQLDGTDGEWRYRGRTDSEQAEGQPISAPSGIVAQKDEGFQRFYKAVVSPSHVRVTAGGRIVPNTRGSVSPGTKPSVDKAADLATSTRTASSFDPAQSYGFPMPPGSFAPMAPFFTGFGPAMIPSMGPVPSPYPGMSWHPGMSFGQGYPIMAGSSPYSQPPPASGDLKETTRHDQRSENGSTRAASSQGPSPDKPHLPPGMQWMMPPASPFHSFAFQPSAGYNHLSQPTPMMPVHMIEQNSQARPNFSKDSHLSVKSAPSRTMPVPSVIGVPKSSIRPSEITKNQLAALRNSLKYLEDQLSYNKHQVDEKGLEHQTEMLKQQIRHFEKNLENQLIFESNHYPKVATAKEPLGRSESSHGHFGSKASIASEDSLERSVYKQSNASNVSLAPSLRSKPAPDKKTAFSTGINSTKSVSAFAPLKTSARNAERLESPAGSISLPVTAALAPPFEPRRRENTPSLSVAQRSNPGTWAEREQLRSDRKVPHSQDTDSQSTWSEAQPHPVQSLPYLVGYLPHGVSAGIARDTDYVYTRPLTEDELRARHMYWGKTPRHLQKGLPKFDGKDFYPPSPIKGRSSDRDTSSSFSSRRLPVGNAAVDYELAQATGEADLFRSLEHRAPRATRGALGIQTQSEAFARSSRGTEDTTVSGGGHKRPGSCTTRVGDNNLSEDVKEASVEASAPSLPDKSSSDETEDDKDLLFKGRKASRQVSGKILNNEIWRSMLKKGKTSSNAVPGAVSSTTVQGVLPQYAGYATASLTPAIANSTTPPPRMAFGKATDAGEGSIAPNLPERKRENLPPTGAEGSANATRLTSASFATPRD